MRTISKPLLLSLFWALVISSCGKSIPMPNKQFDGDSAFGYVEQQMAFGPRIPGSEGHELTRDMIMETLQSHGWDAKIQTGEYRGEPILNIIGSRKRDTFADHMQHIVIGAHYDTRIFADRSADSDDRSRPVPGANDGASGVAVLLELSRVLPEYDNLLVQLVFFDAEDDGYINDWDWILGSRHFAENLEYEPDAVVIVDMIGDKQQEIYMEKSSDSTLRGEIWAVAAGLGIDTFIQEEKYQILDDHTPFLQLGIPAVDLIDFDYPYWHTTGDTLDKVSASSLENVGLVLQDWLRYRDSLGNK